MCEWLANGGEVGIFDATNTTRERRHMIHECCTNNYCFRLIFVESLCNDINVIESNIKEVKIRSPDYKSFDSEKAVQDFQERIQLYEKQYETIDEVFDKNKSFIKIFNVGQKFLVNGISGTFTSIILLFDKKKRKMQFRYFLLKESIILFY